MNAKARTTGTAPPDNLFIYCLKGRVERSCRGDGSDFLGSWEEGEYSFLFFKQPALAAVEALVAASPDLALLDETVWQRFPW